jgi:trigger factor
MIERLRKQQMKYAEVSRAAQSGDRVTIDFEGKIDGVAFPGGKGENIAIVLGEGRMLPDLEQGLIGAAAGESKDISVSFPPDYRATELAGKTAMFATSVKKVEEASLPEVNDEFCALFGVAEGGVAKLREDVTANMQRELNQVLRTRNKNSVLEKLYQLNPLELPQVLIEAQVRDMQVEAMRRAGAKDVSQAPDPQPFMEPARRRVALGLLLNDIIRREKLVAEPARVNERLDEMVGAYGDAEGMKRAYLQNADAMRQVESLTLEDQVVDWILDHAKVTPKPSTFKELMNFEG